MAIHHRVEAAILSATGAVHGVTPGALVEWTDPNGMRRLNLHVEGWSPSLHRVDMVWRASPPPASPVRDQAARLVDAIRPHIAVQRRRAEAGLALGTARPIATGDERTDGVGHVLIDRALAAMMTEDGARPIERQVAEMVAHLHGDRVEAHDGLCEELADDDRIVGRTAYSLQRMGDHLLFDGAMVTVMDFTPSATMAAGAVGCRLSEIVAVPDAVANRRVLRWEDGDDGMSHLWIETRTATVATLVAERDAVAEMAAA